jgi:two-component system CheB/CheR fusion protein
MDGFELCKRMRAEASLVGCRYVSVTGYSMDDVKQSSNLAQFDAHLTKPVDFAMLYRAIAEQLLVCPDFRLSGG